MVSVQIQACRGAVSYCYDGLEAVYLPEDMANITEKALKDRDEEGNEKNPVKECGTEAQNGSPIFKIVNNKEWYVICWLEKEKAEGYERGNTVNIRFADDVQLQMKIHEINEQADKLQIVLSCNRYYEEYDRIRTGTCTLIKTIKNGILLESDSIIEQDGQQGVNVINKLGNAVFVPVKVLISDGETTVVESGMYRDSQGNPVTTISNYAEILRVDKEEDNAN